MLDGCWLRNLIVSGCWPKSWWQTMMTVCFVCFRASVRKQRGSNMLKLWGDWGPSVAKWWIFTTMACTLPTYVVGWDLVASNTWVQCGWGVYSPYTCPKLKINKVQEHLAENRHPLYTGTTCPPWLFHVDWVYLLDIAHTQNRDLPFHSCTS